MQTYRLGSSPMVHAPGVVAWAINGYAFKRDRANMVRVICEGWQGVPEHAAHALLSKRAAFTIEDSAQGDVVVFEA